MLPVSGDLDRPNSLQLLEPHPFGYSPLSQLADSLHISQKQLSRRFRSLTGISLNSSPRSRGSARRSGHGGAVATGRKAPTRPASVTSRTSATTSSA
jgi:AraC-like DNA-binding protein